MSITPHQRVVLVYIREFQQKQRYSPSLSDLTRAFGLSSQNSMLKVINALAQDGQIEKDSKGRILFPIGTIVPQP